jgi:putative PIN family toxin of toxin-antitoxin system
MSRSISFHAALSVTREGSFPIDGIAKSSRARTANATREFRGYRMARLISFRHGSGVGGNRGFADSIYAIMSPMIVVLDTNIFVSSLLGPTGASRAVLRACLDGRLQPLMGAALFAEYESLMGRESILEKCRLTPEEREALLNAFLSVCRWTTIYYSWRPNLRDESDNHLIELAVAGGAAAIITKNARDFASAELHFPGLRILLPEAVLQEI